MRNPDDFIYRMIIVRKFNKPFIKIMFYNRIKIEKLNLPADTSLEDKLALAMLLNNIKSDFFVVYPLNKVIENNDNSMKEMLQRAKKKGYMNA